MYAHSDGYYIYVCATCCRRAIVNHEKCIYYCKHCKGDSNIQEICSAWASSLAMAEISSMNIGMKLTTLPYRMEIPEDEYKGIANQLRSVVQDD